MQLHPEIAQLADRLRRIEDHLVNHEVTQWATMIARCRVSVEKSDASGLHCFLAMFGGMGSLSDIVLQRNGSVLTTENDELREMLSDAWTPGTKLQRDEIAHARNQ